jgi:hypothetical protein
MRGIFWASRDKVRLKFVLDDISSLKAVRGDSTRLDDFPTLKFSLDDDDFTTLTLLLDEDFETIL